MAKTARNHFSRVKCSNCFVTTDNFGNEQTDKTPKEDLDRSTQLLNPSMRPIIHKTQNIRIYGLTHKTQQV